MSTPLESRSEHPFPLSAVILWVPIACYDPDLWATPWQKGAAGCSLSSCHNCMAFGLSWKCENYGVSSPFRHLNDYVCFVYLWLEIAKGPKEFVWQTLLHSYAWVMAFAFGFVGEVFQYGISSFWFPFFCVLNCVLRLWDPWFHLEDIGRSSTFRFLFLQTFISLSILRSWEVVPLAIPLPYQIL